MDMSTLFILRFKRGTAAAQMVYITASNLEKAKEVGQWWCGQNPNTRFVTVEPAVVADEADLKFTTIEARDAAREEARKPKPQEAKK